MKPSMWTHAHGRFAVMQIIACINWAAFSCWLVWVQLYYQTYLNLTPIHTMLRILPMFFSGVVANVIIALIIGRIDVVYIVGALFASLVRLMPGLTVSHSPPSIFSSCGHSPDRMCEHLLCCDRPKRAVLGLWLPLRLLCCAGRRFHVCIRDDVHFQGITAERTERCRRAIPGDDADRIRDRSQRVHDRL
jgi:hypothetical protein